MSSKTDKYAILSGKQGLPASEMYKYKPRETTSTYSDFTSNTPSRFSLRSFDTTPTVDVENTRKAFDGLYDNILSLYSQNGAGQAISGDYRYLTDSLIANALGKDYADVAKNHSYYVRAITGENMDDKSFAEAFGDAWTSYYTNRSIAWKQLMFDWSNDEEEKANLLGDIADLEDVLVKKGDYSNRGFVAKNLVASAPVMNQIIEAVGITLAGNVIGSSVAGVGASVSMGNALKNVATASKLAKVGTGLGIATNVANTFTVETGSLSRELYNMTDENGNRISDTQRKVASMLGGAVVTALEYATPDPFFGFTKLGKGLPKSVAKQSFGKWLATAGLNRIKDASSESFEEGLQSVASYIAKDIAKWYGNNSGDTNFNLDSAEQSLYNAIVEGVDSFKDTFTPMLVASFLPGTARDLTTLRRSIKNSRDAKMHEKNSPTARRESGKWQAESADPNVISMDLINLKAGSYDTDYSLDIDEKGKAKKLGKVNVIQDPNNPDMFIGATEKDDDILKWAYDKKFKAVDVNVLEYGSAVMDEESIGNIARAFGGDFKDGIATVDSKESLDAMEKTLEDAGLSVNTGDGSFTFTNEETGKETTVRIATQDERDVASAMSKSEGVISNRDFVKEIKNALTADGQIETQVTDDEIALVSSLACMLGNDVTSKMEFVSAYSDNVSLDEAEAVGGAKGATVFSSDATKSARIILSDNSDASTVAHEMFHVAHRYNESARGKLVDAVSKTVSNKNSRRGLRQFLSEHTEELKRAGIQNVDDAMRILDGITRDNVLSTAENQEVLTSMTANDSILYQSSSPEENVAREFSSDRNASQRYTFAYFTEKDVSDMIDAGIYVPPMLLDKYPENEAVIREKSDRLMMENFLVDNEVRKALVASKNVEQFLESMRQYYDTAYNANTEAILRKIFAYDKMQTPSQMRAWFKSEYATGNIDKLMELKAMVGLRRSTKISKNGKVYTTVSVPDSSFAYNKLMNLDRTSSKEAVKEVTDSIQRNPNPWIRDYIKASQMDYAKKFEGSEVGGYDYLKAKSDLMYLSLGSTEFNLINEIREASKANDFTPDEIKEQESIKESRKALEREARELQKELKMEGSEPSGTTPLEMSMLFYEDEISAITDRSNEEIAKLKEKMDINSLVSSMREDELKAKYKKKIEKLKAEKNERIAKLKAKYKKKIEKLEAEKNERIAKLNETLKDVRTKRDEQYKELRDKKNQKIDEIREDRNRKLRELSSYYNARISNLKLRRDTTIAKIKLVNRFKKDLKVDHSVYSADIDEVYKWMYCLIRNKQKMSTIDYERYAMKKGETTDSDVLIFSFEPSDYRMSIDEENTSGLELNEVDDANSPSLEYEFNPNAYNFDRTDVPLSLMEFGFSPEALREITDPERRFDSFSYDTLVELYEAFSAAKRISKATKSAMDSAKRQKRAELAGKMYGTIARTEAGIPADALHAVLRSIGATEEEYRHDPDVRAKAMSEFTKGISRYSDILQHKLTARDRFFSFASNSIGHIQWVADFLESNKNGAFHKLFVDRAQTALNNYEAMRRKRTREAMDAIKSAAGGDEMWAKIHKELTSKDASIDVTYNQNGTKLDEYSYRSGKITLNQALGIYIYAKNYQSLGNLLSGKGNNFSLETLARINPEAMKRFLGEEMAMRDEFVPETKFFTDSRGNIIPYKTRFTDSLFKNNTKAEIYDVYGRLVNGEFDSGMPSWFSKIGDAIVETLSGKDNEYTNRLAKFSAEVLNNPFTFQESYFPKVSDGRVKVSAIGEVSGAKSKHVSTGAVKDRQTAFNYPLRLDPINVMLGAIEAQERMVNMYETVSDMNYLMSDKGSNFGAIISARYGDGMRKFIESQIADLAGNKPILSDYEKLGNVFLQNVSTSKIALNFMTALKQFLSVFPATFNGELKMHDLLNGVALASGNNKTTADALYRKYATDVADSSLGYEYTMMKRRMEATGLNTMRTKLLDFSMGFTNWSDQKVKKWVFMGAFDKYLKQGMSESDAGLRATEIVKKTQSIGDSYSLSNFERNRSPFVRAFAMFSKDMFNIWNSIVFGAFGADVNNKDFFQIGERMLGIGILSLASALVAGGFIPDDDDDGAFDEDAFFEDLYSNLIGYVPFFGTFFSNDGSDSLLTEPVMKIKDMFDTVGSATMKISEGEDIEEEANKFINAGLDALGAVGVPSVAVKRAIKMFAPDGLISDDYAFNPGWLFGKTGASTFNLVF